MAPCVQGPFSLAPAVSRKSAIGCRLTPLPLHPLADTHTHTLSPTPTPTPTHTPAPTPAPATPGTAPATASQRGEKLRDVASPAVGPWPANLTSALERPLVVYDIDAASGETRYPPLHVALPSGQLRPLNEQEKVCACAWQAVQAAQRSGSVSAGR